MMRRSAGWILAGLLVLEGSATAPARDLNDRLCTSKNGEEGCDGQDHREHLDVIGWLHHRTERGG